MSADKIWKSLKHSCGKLSWKCYELLKKNTLIAMSGNGGHQFVLVELLQPH
jgi:hypothetical protein